IANPCPQRRLEDVPLDRWNVRRGRNKRKTAARKNHRHATARALHRRAALVGVGIGWLVVPFPMPVRHHKSTGGAGLIVWHTRFPIAHLSQTYAASTPMLTPHSPPDSPPAASALPPRTPSAAL